MANDMIDARDEYISLLRKELLGPGSEVSYPDEEHELISSSPEQRYSIGILFPQKSKINADNDEILLSSDKAESYGEEETENNERDQEMLSEAEEKNRRKDSMEYRHENYTDYDNADEEYTLDDDVSLASQNRPSSVGMTFLVDGSSKKVTFNLKFATYRKAKVGDCRTPYIPRNPENYELPVTLQQYVKFERETGYLCLLMGGVTRKKVKELTTDKDFGEDGYFLIDALYKLATFLSSGYVAQPHECKVTVDFSESDYQDCAKNLDGTAAKLTALRRNVAETKSSITVMMVNELEENPTGDNCIFRPQIEVNTDDNDFKLVDYTLDSDFTNLDDEEQALELQYRNKKTYATGLGTSVNWEVDEFGKGKIYNDFFPSAEVPGMNFSLPEEYNVSESTLSMRYLSDLDIIEKSKKINDLTMLVSAYEKWIDKIENQAKLIVSENSKYQKATEKTIGNCRKSLRRMMGGIDTLSKDKYAWDAFQLANRAMFMQRLHLNLQHATADPPRYMGDEELGELLRKIDYTTFDTVLQDKYQCHDKYLWRPFQLAFLLMSINSISDEKSSDRDIVDLIWFPTGGGKTEAYLGLTAFTIFYRRMAYPKACDGTTVIMRYTLRLLAAQQFTRASTLICACEYIRKDAIRKKQYALGENIITIGLWIGSEHTPNTNEEAKKNLHKLNDINEFNARDIKDRYNKFQVLKCPWCGTKMVVDFKEKKKIGIFGYRMKNNSKFEFFCPQEDCQFNGILPVQVVDQELYTNPPTLLFGTVDKFAMMPWKQEIGNYFGVGGNNRSPELIIQDELHLISGQLGTMVGLYEAAIDMICKERGNSPKIVASTATIRRAAEQCSALYNREVSQFPPPGIDVEDSFFAREAEIDHKQGKYGRIYIGLMPAGKTKAMMEIRTMSALLQYMQEMKVPETVKDKYWTLTAYFNSLRDLGKCSTLVDDDIKDAVKRLAKRNGTIMNQRRFGKADELTSRVSTTELNETLDKLEKLTYSEENIEAKRYASSVLLATNMISVGIDVARLNTMVMVGQPKLTSEYIQASSRVGREYPGVVFALFDGGKSRDRSHYEQFISYHNSFYKYVEPTGATPFSKPARDRALHAVVISIIRNSEKSLAANAAAADFKVSKYVETIEKIKTNLALRDKEIVKRQNNGMKDESSEICEEIDFMLSQWESMANKYGADHFIYGTNSIRPMDPDKGRLMKAFGTDLMNKDSIETMTSMRNVDVSVPGSILIWEDDLA